MKHIMKCPDLFFIDIIKIPMKHNRCFHMKGNCNLWDDFFPGKTPAIFNQGDIAAGNPASYGDRLDC